MILAHVANVSLKIQGGVVVTVSGVVPAFSCAVCGAGCLRLRGRVVTPNSVLLGSWFRLWHCLWVLWFLYVDLWLIYAVSLLIASLLRVSIAAWRVAFWEIRPTWFGHRSLFRLRKILKLVFNTLFVYSRLSFYINDGRFNHLLFIALFPYPTVVWRVSYVIAGRQALSTGIIDLSSSLGIAFLDNTHANGDDDADGTADGANDNNDPLDDLTGSVVQILSIRLTL